MWRTVERWHMRLKTGLNFSFITRLFKRRNHSQFDSSEDIFSDAREYLETDSEEDNDSLTCEHVERVDQNRDMVNIENNPNGVDQRNVQLHCEPDRVSLTRRPDILENDRIIPFVRNTHSNLPFTYPLTTASSTKFVQDKVKAKVASFGMQGYNRLKDSEEDDIIVSDSLHNDVTFTTFGDRDNANHHVFHSIEDVPNNSSDKSRKRRKKIVKRTRRAIVVSMKWIKRGFASYAGSLSSSFNAATFFTISNTGLYRQKY